MTNNEVSTMKFSNKKAALEAKWKAEADKAIDPSKFAELRLKMAEAMARQIGLMSEMYPNLVLDGMLLRDWKISPRLGPHGMLLKNWDEEHRKHDETIKAKILTQIDEEPSSEYLTNLLAGSYIEDLKYADEDDEDQASQAAWAEDYFLHDRLLTPDATFATLFFSREDSSLTREVREADQALEQGRLLCLCFGVDLDFEQAP